MSGLAAIFQRDGRPVDPAAAWAMLGAIPYRGPDGVSVARLGEVVLGHASLATTPEDQATRQPLASPRTGNAIIADVRLDNRADLLAELPQPPSSTASDAELILHAYDSWGLEALPRLLGDFAFVIWDQRHHRLVCGRDTSGQRSLVYHLDGRQFTAASEIHQLLQLESVPLEADDERIREFLVPINVHRNEKDVAATFYAGISSVPAGHVLVVDRETHRLWRYWELGPVPEIRYRRDREYAEHYRDLLFRVVRPRLRSAGPIGALLSGGLDSSSVVCVAHELMRSGQAPRREFATFSQVFNGLDCDERPFIRDVQAKYGFAAHFLPAEDAATWLQLEPRGFQESPNAILHVQQAAYAAATRAGVRVLLTGTLGDSSVGGSPLVFDTLLRGGRLRELARRLRSYHRTSDESLPTTIALHCATPLLPLAVQRRLMTAYLRRSYQRARAYLLPSWIPEPLRQELSQRHLDAVLAEERARRFANPTRHFEFGLLYPPEKAWQPVGWPLELWQPFADRRLHAFLLAIPPEEKFAPPADSDEYYAASKTLVRRAMRGIVPDSILDRTSKTVFASVFEADLRRRWPTYVAAFGPGARPQVAARGYVDQQRFWKRLQMLRDGERFSDFGYVMRVVGLETWLRGVGAPRPRASTVSMPPDSQSTCEHGCSAATFAPEGR
jgi:asparagine synthase (glutamine-hydrolysing)